MANNIYGVGLRNVGSYQVAGTPYLTASNLSNEEKQFEFPNVTKKIIVENTHIPNNIMKKLFEYFFGLVGRNNWRAQCAPLSQNRL